MTQTIEGVTVTLLSPVLIGDTTIAQLTFREAEVGDLLEAEKCEGELERVIVMMAATTGHPLATIKKIKARDLKNIMKQVGTLLGNEPASTTGTA